MTDFTWHQVRTAKLLIGWYYLTGRQYFLDDAIKIVASYDKEGRWMDLKQWCIRSCQRFSPNRSQIGFKRTRPVIVVDTKGEWFDSAGRWIGKEYDELCLEAIHSALLSAYGLK